MPFCRRDRVLSLNVPTVRDTRLEEALRHLHPPTGTKLWHGGATVLGALRGVSPEEASWNPYANRHSIWELALHIAYWNYAVSRRIAGGRKGTFPRSPADWPALPEDLTAPTWSKDRRLVKDCHDRLVKALRNFDPSRLADIAGETGRTTYADLITGIVLHDTYHVGQIQLLKRLATSHREQT